MHIKQATLIRESNQVLLVLQAGIAELSNAGLG